MATGEGGGQKVREKKERLVRCLTCNRTYFIDHPGPLKVWEWCAYDDCHGKHYRAVKAEARK
jgi:hypothetical protein